VIVLANDQVSDAERKKDEAVAELLNQSGIQMETFHDQCIIPPGELLTKEHKPFIEYSHFKKSPPFPHLF